MGCGVLILFCGLCVSIVLTDLIRQTDLGLVQGTLEQWDNRSVECYLGIPYAAPPVNLLRFQPPQPHLGWNNTLNATEFGPMCPQELDQVAGNEDCLKLNIYVPCKKVNSSKLLTVMVWLHGGAFVFGSGNYKAHVLADFGQVIVVTINYRLGVFGFLSTGDHAAIGNSGLLDQHFAILWIKTNIRNFGGNPEAIAIFGQSAGGSSVGLQCLSPLNTGVFKRAILQSGVAIAPWAVRLDDPSMWAKKLASILFCPVNDSLKLISCLQEKQTAELVKGAIKLRDFNFFFGPTVDGVFLPKPPRELSRNVSLVNRFTYMAGVNSHEGSFAWPQIKKIKTQADFVKFTSIFLQVAADKVTTMSDATLWEYKDWKDLNDSSFHLQRQALEVVGDAGFVAPLVKTSEFMAKATQHVYIYYFTRHPNTSESPEWIGARHGDELVFVFGVPTMGGPLVGKEEHDLSQQMMSYWTNFAKTGNPNFPMKVPVIWPKYNKRTSQYLQLDVNLSKQNIKKHLKPEQVTFWNQYIPSLLNVKECPITKPLLDPLVQTQNGLLRGIRVQQNNRITDIFQGIPYAQPPIGELRFQKPRPLKPWKGIKHARKYGNICMQDRVFVKDVHGDEDCLFLNIWIPNGVQEALRKKLAVMIWIHGGAFTVGASQGIGYLNDTSYDGNELAHHGNVIVVSVNYRLAALGFLSTGDSNGRGNYGLWDQHMAITWVKNNIASFGGNPELITLFGESAGGACTNMHALSPVSKGLFRRAISESGDARAIWAVNRNPLRSARRVAQAVGCPLEDTAAMMFCLRQVPAKDIMLVIRVTELFTENKIVFFIPFVPTIDGDFLPAEPEMLFENSRDVDYLLGCNNGDGHLFVATWFPGVNIPFGISEAKFRTAVEKGVGSLGEAAVESAIFEYTDWENPTQLSRRQGLSRLYTDFEFCSPAFNSAQKHAIIGRNASRTYAYQFSYPSKMSNIIWPGWVGALHTEELQFVFGIPFSKPKSYNQQERNLSQAMMTYWTNFVKTGNPNHPQSVPVIWPEHSIEKHYIELNASLNQGSVGSNLRAKQFAMWNELISKMVTRNIDCLQDQFPPLNGTTPPLNPPIVTVQQGQVKGFNVQDFLGGHLQVFLKIPYASPPVGDLRFKPPEESRPWSGILDATELGPACPQSPTELPFKINRTSEDCLYLNVYAPVGVVVVEFNYRLGPFGFLSTLDVNAPGNLGFLDMTKALQWIQHNIQNFGGDPSSITLFGYGAGGLAVSYLLLSPLSRGLFHRAISSSGNALVPDFIGKPGSFDPLVASQQLAKALDCPTDNNMKMVECLQTKPMESFFDAPMSKSKHGPKFLPVVDGIFLQELPQESLLKGNYMKVPYIIGLTNDEAGVQLVNLLGKDDGITTETYLKLVSDYAYSHFRYNPSQISDVISYSYRDFTCPDDPGSLRNGFRDLVQDHKWLTPSYQLADQHSSRAETFLYIYSHTSSFSKNPPWVGASHLDDLPYLLGDPVAKNSTHQYNEAEKQLSFSLMAYWTNFAHSGNPNRGPHKISSWPNYTATGTEFMNFTANGSDWISRAYRRQQTAFWSKTVLMMQSEEWCNKVREPSSPGNTTTARPTATQSTVQCQVGTHDILSMKLTPKEIITAFYITFSILLGEVFLILGLVYKLCWQQKKVKKLQDQFVLSNSSDVPFKAVTYENTHTKL
ncbi:uncharacterized protein LOC125448388 isoform X2 [Stegostoma tigrinum]|uniref:uncharacterized protein LOC125448388 isoform X2 n=1 Tax=Stegostoma tigrinum TaxID=3053191 RepID=UPI0028708ED2|nr:uncharacterized protein LOC125448388 isoform X2 [Stegostoma tigrinum]